MKAYRIKHVPTGLYYKPGIPNLSKKGKIYGHGGDALTFWKGYEEIPCTIKRPSPIYKTLCKVDNYKEKCSTYSDCTVYIPRNQFEKEEII